jgi:hypothetical protein
MKRPFPVGSIVDTDTMQTLNDTREMRRAQAEIFAALANVKKLSEFRPWQIEKTLEEAKACYLDLSAENLPEVHRWAHYLINRRLDDGKVNVSEFYKKLARPVSLEGNSKITVIRYDFDLAKPYDDTKSVLGTLWNVVTQHPFPFRRCLVCKTAFVVAGKKKYCSPRCTNFAIGPRTEYMRAYMKKKRANDKRKKAKGE